MSRLRVVLGPALNRWLRLTRVRIASQIFFLALFVLAVWATWTSRLGGYPVSALLELDPLVMLSTVLATGYVYKLLGWGLIIVAITFLFGRVFCNWMCPYGTLHQFIGWLFDNRPAHRRIEQNRYHPVQFLKYSILIVFLLMSAMGALQIGLLDPICLLHRSVTAAILPTLNMPTQSIFGDYKMHVGGWIIGFLLLIVVSGHLVWFAERGDDDAADDDDSAAGLLDGPAFAPFDDPAARDALFAELRRGCGAAEVVELDAHVNDAEFARAAATAEIHRLAARLPHPVAFMEGELLYNFKGEVPEDDDFVIPLGVADVKREGDDVTILTHGKMVHVALQAAQKLEKDGVHAEVVDLRTLSPLDHDTIAQSVQKTHKAVVVQEAVEMGGVAAQVVKSLMDSSFDYLDAPVLKCTGKDVPMPYAANLEKLALPNVGEVIDELVQQGQRKILVNLARVNFLASTGVSTSARWKRVVTAIMSGFLPATLNCTCCHRVSSGSSGAAWGSLGGLPKGIRSR